MVSKLDKETVDNEAAAAIYEKLESILDPTFLTKGTGTWTGGSISTSHPSHAMLISMKWAGKVFRTPDDVDPVMVFGEDGKWVWNEKLGHAQLREMAWNGKNTTAMIYDTYPIIDYFRKVNSDTMMGVMDTKLQREAGLYYFYLTRK
ncbi:hypothetical protein FIBSPDRAFT_845275 [Athelia psychrophila]|uniref:Uncharacterized protein n=1 Tax=Athelia psychrophila TaxID=1759441 RepID=A0A167TM29_9AGAM|nr:hypothetical protein FIBSPDRAFT_845275 [Fibularhizoctonia sp. CBS 109695]